MRKSQAQLVLEGPQAQKSDERGIPASLQDLNKLTDGTGHRDATRKDTEATWWGSGWLWQCLHGATGCSRVGGGRAAFGKDLGGTLICESLVMGTFIYLSGWHGPGLGR